MSPSQETLLSDYVITLAGKSITITSHDIIMTAVSLVIGLVFWAALYFSRKRIVSEMAMLRQLCTTLI